MVFHGGDEGKICRRENPNFLGKIEDVSAAQERLEERLIQCVRNSLTNTDSTHGSVVMLTSTHILDIGVVTPCTRSQWVDSGLLPRKVPAA
ncbi:hypothetical protein U1Q18_001429, partial [Sarracenia purpurea var. burkii]